jgi:predicted transcriptional regulator
MRKLYFDTDKINLTQEQIKQIVEEFCVLRKTELQISKRYNLPYNTIYRIVNSHKWNPIYNKKKDK